MQTIEKLKQEDNNRLFLVCKENKTLIGQFAYVLLLQVFYVSRPLYKKKKKIAREYETYSVVTDQYRLIILTT